MSSSYDPSHCDYCGAQERREILHVEGRSMTSDGRALTRDLLKVACTSCGLIRNGLSFDGSTLDQHYEEEYQLGDRAASSEPLFYIDDEAIPRSKVIFDWMSAAINTLRDAPPQSILEIGCGEGSLMARFEQTYTSAQTQGLDMSRETAAQAANRGLDVSQGSYDDAAGSFDLIYSFAVIEHVPSPTDFLRTLRGHLAGDGMLIVAQPCQDNGSSDIFFNDHLHHFHSDHLAALAKKTGLREHYRDVGFDLIPNFSLHVFEKSSEHAAPTTPQIEIESTVQQWTSMFNDVNRWLDQNASVPLAVWGLGQTFDLLTAYTDLHPSRISIGFDDNLSRFAGEDWPFPIRRFTDWDTGSLEPRLLLTFDPPRTVRVMIRRRGLEYYSPVQ